MAREFYGATVQAQHSINKILSLPASGREQDWEFEMADPGRIEEILSAMSRVALSYDEKCALALLAIASIEESIEEGGIDNDLVEKAKATFSQDASIRDAMFFYWIEQDRVSTEEIVQDILTA